MANVKPPEPVRVSDPPSSKDICLDGLSVMVDGVPLIHKLNHRFTSGQWHCLLGISGVGKSMLLRAILGLLSDTVTGDIHVEGSIATSAGSSLQGRVAYMAQQDLLLPWLSVHENVVVGGKLRNCSPPGTDRADQLLQATGLRERADDLPAQLSGGMRQRVALARTLWEDKPIILMDEPFSALDAISRLHAQDLASRLLVGRTVIMVTHDPLEAIRLADHIYILSGRPAVLGNPISPAGTAPRAVDNTDVLTLQGQLLSQLGEVPH